MPPILPIISTDIQIAILSVCVALLGLAAAVFWKGWQNGIRTGRVETLLEIEAKKHLEGDRRMGHIETLVEKIHRPPCVEVRDVVRLSATNATAVATLSVQAIELQRCVTTVTNKLDDHAVALASVARDVQWIRETTAKNNGGH